jgi:type IV pilus assembly protein PilB
MTRKLFPFRRKQGLGKPDGGEVFSGLQDNQAISGLSNLYAPQEEADACVRDIADVLMEMGKLTGEQLRQLRQIQEKRPSCDVVQILGEQGLAGAEDVLMARAQLYGFQFRRINPQDVDKEAFEKLELSYIKNNRIMPVGIDGDRLVVATSRPADVFVIDDVKRQAQMNVEVVVCPDEDIARVCEPYAQDQWRYCVDDMIQDMAGTEVEFIKETEKDVEDLEKVAGESPIIKFVNYLITSALHEGASDIHIEAKEKNTRIRYRVDGVLFDTRQIPAGMHPAVVSRLKIMSNLDISERRLPQDGRIAAMVGGRAIDLRVSVLPTSHGEKVVVRILDSRSILLGLDQLGMSAQALRDFSEQVRRPHGIMLVTGPTGSGKTTTLYSSLSQMDGQKLNISTVEDPVEYQLEFCNQVQVNEKVGLTFAAALRSLLRQDPDVIMIGEIRDQETARTAVQAALTGHLVLSTLHTNDAPSSVTRLVDIGVEPYLIAACLNGVLAQRLVRKICPDCKEQYKVPANMTEALRKAGVGESEVYQGAGCQSCRNCGYSGRVGIYELMVVDETFREMMTQDPSINHMRKVFARSGQASLYEDGMDKVRQGITTIEEVMRVTEAHAEVVAGLPGSQCVQVPVG